MRAGFNNALLCDRGGSVIAVNLGADFVSEHEWGIPATRRAFGMVDDAYGLERRRIRKVPELLEWAAGEHHNGKKTTKWAGLWLRRYKNGGARPPTSFGESRSLWTGWSDGDFGAFSVKDGEQMKLLAIHEAIIALDACIWLGRGVVFENGGMCIGITSRMDPAHLRAWDRTDREAVRLKTDAAATGIEARIQKAGLGYFALSPARERDGSIRFWLNPMRQDVYESRWCTVADLDEWIAGRGPVIKKGRRR